MRLYMIQLCSVKWYMRTEGQLHVRTLSIFSYVCKGTSSVSYNQYFICGLQPMLHLWPNLQWLLLKLAKMLMRLIMICGTSQLSQF